MKRRSVLIAALAAPSIVPAVALGQGAWPNKTVKFICPFAPGGGTDTVSRLMCDQLSKSLGQTFVVDNKGGGGGVLGVTEVKRAAPDGYTILCTISSSLIQNRATVKDLPYDPEKDFIYLGSTTGGGGNAALAGGGGNADDGGGGGGRRSPDWIDASTWWWN